MKFAGGFGSPYRAPCGGWPAKPVLVLGDCSSAYMPPAPVSRYLNTTKVPTYLTTGPSTISPYARPLPGSGITCNGGSAPDGDPFCGPWPEIVQDNTFSASGTVNTPSSCRKIGFKNIFGMKAWHGIAGFGTSDACCQAPDKPAITAAAPANRYRTLSWDATVSFCSISHDTTGDPGGHDPAFNGTAGTAPDTVFRQTGSTTINQTSGKKTSTVTNLASGDIAAGGLQSEGYAQPSSDPVIYNVSTDYGNGVGVFPTVNGATCQVIDDILTGFGYCRTKLIGVNILSISGGVVTTDVVSGVQYGDYVDIQGNTGGNTTHAQITSVDNSVPSFTVGALSGSAGGWIVLYQWSPTFPGLAGGGDGVYGVGVGLGKDRAVYFSNISAANPAEVTATAHGLLTNDTVQFWSVVPFGGGTVGSDLVDGTSAVVTVIDADHFTLNGVDTTGLTPATGGYITTPLANGSYTARDLVDITITGETQIQIQFNPATMASKMGIGGGPGGSPMPVLDLIITLSDPYSSDDVNADFETLLDKWDLTDDDVYPWRTDLNVTAGPMVTYLEQPPRPPDFQAYGYTDPSPLDGRILGAPNPFGYDPFWDFRAVIFATGGGGCNASTVGGNPPSYIPQTATQWTNVTDQCSLLPHEFRAFSTLVNLLNPSTPSAYFSGYLIGSKYAEIKVPWFSHNFARPCGPKDLATIDQIDVSDGGSFNCSNPAPYGNYRWAGKPCWCNDPTQTTGCTGHTNPNAVNQWFDNQPKGDFTVVSYGFNFRDDQTARPDTVYVNSITAVDYCLAFLPCSPAVICISPNGEAFTNGLTINPGHLTLDGCYGAQRQTMVRQWMQDPLWEYPHHICPSGVRIEDDGSGTVSGANFPLRPFEESRTTVPAGAPALPAGFYLNILSASDINSGVTTGQNLYPPPTAPGGDGSCDVNSVLSPFVPVWFYYANMLANTAGNFSCDYNDPLAVCADDPEVVP